MKKLSGFLGAVLGVLAIAILCVGVYCVSIPQTSISGSLGIIPSEKYEEITLSEDFFKIDGSLVPDGTT